MVGRAAGLPTAGLADRGVWRTGSLGRARRDRSGGRSVPVEVFAGRKLGNDRSHWYDGHCLVEGLPLHLLRLRGGLLDDFHCEFESPKV